MNEIERRKTDRFHRIIRKYLERILERKNAICQLRTRA
jgi:hypothetical protein